MKFLWTSLLFIVVVHGLNAQVLEDRSLLDPSLQLEKQDTLPVKPDTINTPGENRLVIENDGKRIVILEDSTTIQYFYENVRGVQDSSYFFADSAVLTDNYFQAQGRVIIIQSDTIQLFADSLYYDRDSSIVEMYGDVIFQNGDQSLACQTLYYDLDRRVAFYLDTAVLTKGDTKLQSLRGRYDVRSKRSFFYQDVVMIGPDLIMRTDSMYFLTEENKVNFLAPTRIKTKDSEIYCEKGFYFLDTKQGEFIQNAQYKSGDKIVEGEKIIYDDITKQVDIEGETNFTTNNGRGNAESISYLESTADLILTGDAYYETTDRIVSGERVVYNEKSGEVFIAGNGYLSQDGSIINATNIDYNEVTGIGFVDGDVVWRDTVNNTTIESDVMNINTLLNATRSYNYESKPLMTIGLAQDSLYMSCDTLYSFQLIDTLNNKREYVVGDGNVEILKNDLQAIADSMIFYITDSIFSLHQEPIMWSDSSQFTGDTIHFYLKNKQIDEMKIRNDAMIITTSDNRFYNQIGGRDVTGFFIQDTIDHFLVEGNAESVYYVLDELNAYIGVNTTTCSILKFKFEQNEIKHIRGYVEVKQKMTPMDKANHEALKLKGFRWVTEGKPKNIELMKIRKE